MIIRKILACHYRIIKIQTGAGGGARDLRVNPDESVGRYTIFKFMGFLLVKKYNNDSKTRVIKTKFIYLFHTNR